MPSTGARQFTLLSTTTQTAPFCVGFALRKGDIPSGSGITITGATAQATVKNSWPDGSAKFAVVAGTASLTAGVAATVSLSMGTASSGAALTLANLQAAMVQPVTVGCGSFGSASWSGSDWASPFQTWIVGPRMSSWIFRKPIGSDAHLAAWLEVRLWDTGEVEILPWVENGYLLVAGPTGKSAIYTFAMNGTTRFSASINLPHHCRTPLLSGSITSHWLSTAHDVIVKHDATYMQTTGLVPAYFAKTPSSAAVVSALPATFTPLQQGVWPNVMGSGGYSPSIGLLPEWDVLYLTSAATSTYKGVIFQAYSAGRYATHYRDEATNLPARLSLHTALAIRQPEAGYTTTPATSGSTPAMFGSSHQPSVGYLAYLLTGWRYFLDELQMVASSNALSEPVTARDGASGIYKSSTAGSVRHAAWQQRTLAQAITITPDSEATYRTEYLDQLARNIDYYHAKYIAQANNPQGYVQPYEPAGAYGSGTLWMGAPWMQDFMTAVWGYIKDLELSASTKMDALFAWKAQSVVGRLGTAGATEFLYRDYGVYTVALSPSPIADFDGGTGPWYANWGAVYDATFSGTNPDTTSSASPYASPGPKVAGDLRSYMNPEFPSAIALPAIAYAVKHGVPGAQAAYQRLTTASNWNDLLIGVDAEPVWGVAPGVFLR